MQACTNVACHAGDLHLKGGKEPGSDRGGKSQEALEEGVAASREK